tara:strand:+ start:828 stop:1214 length:387 start_codon:yes stop_codon:yes gene_type:complete
MITITLNITNLNDSLQVGDMVYSTSVNSQAGANDLEDTAGALGNVGTNQLVGILRRITIEPNNVILDIDETVLANFYTPVAGDFLMFSKWNQTDGDVIGYYAKASFINNSKEKAELFSVGSEIVINSK